MTPGGSMLMDLASKERHMAICNLMEALSHMPYTTWKQASARGYAIVPMTNEYKRRKENKQDTK